MNFAHIPVQIRTGGKVRVDGRLHIVGAPVDQMRIFADAETGTERSLRYDAILHMMRSGRITTDASFRLLPPSTVANLSVDWGAFTDIEKNSALAMYPFVKAMDDLPIKYRDKRKHVEPMIEKVMADEKNTIRPENPPKFRKLRDWYKRWLATGRDIRSLVVNHRKKGNRKPRRQEWEIEAFRKGINETYRNDLKGSKGDAWWAVHDAILLHAKEHSLKRSDLGAERVIGKHAVTKIINKMELYDLTYVRHGKREADMLMRAIRKGPPCSMPLEEIEADHTPLDIMVVDDQGRLLGRPYLTAIIDRYSRMILGFALHFTPPSWVSVMEALRMAVQPKDRFLDEVCRAAGRPNDFVNPYPCFGAGLRLFVDNGSEFRSNSMKETESALDMQIVDLPRARGDLKGRVERWLGTLNRKVVHRAPGTTKGSIKDRGNYKSAKEACLTLPDMKWAVTKYVVDYYNVDKHSETDETPLARWQRGIAEVGERPAPPDDIIVPLTGLVVPRKLGPSGIEFETLRWNSNAFSALRNRIGANAIVQIRIDPFDLSTAYVLDPTRAEDKNAWVKGLLQNDPDVAKMTLYQFRQIKKVIASGKAGTYDIEAATQRAEAMRQILDLYQSKSKSKAPPREIVRFKHDGRNPGEHIRGERFAPDESEAPIGAHDHHDQNLKSPSPDERGPWRDRVPALEPPPPNVEVLDPSEETADPIPDGNGTPTSPKPEPTVKIEVRRRRYQ
ncbi:MAG: DDE-type integrase/transposase/recombinase [Afipia sp.]|mgnify:CR=1 FL=1|nr:DDE-type integrase/transposase/recombinase [Afipia sp.]OJW61611.1 MAG: hypothetical protein BGO65_09455 [Afipia sp. 64-13]